MLPSSHSHTDRTKICLLTTTLFITAVLGASQTKQGSAAKQQSRVTEITAFTPVGSIVFSSDGRRILAGGGLGDNGELHLFRVDTAREIRGFSGFTSHVDVVAFTSDDRHVLSGDRHGVQLWDVETGKELSHSRYKYGSVGTYTDLSSDGRRALYLSLGGSAGGTSTVLVDLTTGNSLHHGFGGEDGVFSFDSHQAATVSRVLYGHSTVVVWNVDTGRELRRFVTAGNEEIHAVTFSPDGRRVFGAGSTVHLWDIPTGKEIRQFGTSDLFLSVSVSRDGRRLLAADRKVVAVWDVDTGKQIGRTEGTGPVALAPDGRLAAFCSGTSPRSTIRLWRLSD